MVGVLERLGYESGRAPRARKHFRFGLVIEQLPLPVLQDIFYAEVIAGMESALKADGHGLLLHVLEPGETVSRAIQALREQGVDGALLLGGGDITDDGIRELASSSFPFVLVDNYVVGEKLDCVLPDNVMAGYLATRHLLDLGHRRIAVLEGPPKYKTLTDRLDGYLRALTEADLAVDPALMIKPVSGTPRKGYLQMHQVLALPERPTGVVAISDKTAFGALEAIREVGLKVPDDVSIVGIDDVLESEHTSPPLTTVRLPKREFGRLAIEKLVRRIRSPRDLPSKTQLYTELIVRSTTGRPAPGAPIH